jgi:hypothetical protein
VAALSEMNRSEFHFSVLFTIQLFRAGVAIFFFVQCTKMGENIPNYHKIYQMSISYIKWPQNGPNVNKMYISL